jgi:hypothetical protein
LSLDGTLGRETRTWSPSPATLVSPAQLSFVPVNGAFAPVIDTFDLEAGRIAASAVVGGTAAELGGGKFANGAVTAAFLRLYNEEQHRDRQSIEIRRALPVTGQYRMHAVFDGHQLDLYDGSGIFVGSYASTSGRQGVTDTTMQSRFFPTAHGGLGNLSGQIGSPSGNHYFWTGQNVSARGLLPTVRWLHRRGTRGHYCFSQAVWRYDFNRRKLWSFRAALILSGPEHGRT